MDDREPDNVMAFDTLFTTNQIQVMKALLPYFEPSAQKHLAIYIKFQELQYTISYFQSHPYQLCSCSSSSENMDMKKICSQILPYCSEDQKKKVQQMEQMMQSMEMYQELMQAMELMKELTPDSEDGGPAGDGENKDENNGEAGGMNLNMDMLMELLSPEQKNMFEMLKGGF